MWVISVSENQRKKEKVVRLGRLCFRIVRRHCSRFVINSDSFLISSLTDPLQLERQEEALADTDASLLLAPNSFKALRTRARINLHLEQYDSSIADFKSAIQQAQTEGSATDADVRALQSELKKAEAALKRSKTKDYYKILGVSRDCTEIEIKKAYRRESLIHHPDKVSFSFPSLSDPPAQSGSGDRAATKRNSNWWWRRTPCFPIHDAASDTIWARTRMG